MPVIDLANPTRFLAGVNRVLPWLIAATVILFAVGLFRAMNAPDDYQQGATVKIMFLHVPAAWLGMFGWGLMSIAALGTLVWRHPLADVAGKALPAATAAAPVTLSNRSGLHHARRKASGRGHLVLAAREISVRDQAGTGRLVQRRSASANDVASANITPKYPLSC